MVRQRALSLRVGTFPTGQIFTVFVVYVVSLKKYFSYSIGLISFSINWASQTKWKDGTNNLKWKRVLIKYHCFDLVFDWLISNFILLPLLMIMKIVWVHVSYLINILTSMATSAKRTIPNVESESHSQS